MFNLILEASINFKICKNNCKQLAWDFEMFDIVHTLKGQWDGIVGDSDAKISQRHEFLIVRTTTPFMTSNYGTLYWHFQPLK